MACLLKEQSDRLGQGFRFDRFRNKPDLVGPELSGEFRFISVCGHIHGMEMGANLSYSFHHLKAVHVRHLDVAHDHVKFIFRIAYKVDCLKWSADFDDLVFRGGQHFCDGLANHRVVINEQDSAGTDWAGLSVGFCRCVCRLMYRQPYLCHCADTGVAGNVQMPTVLSDGASGDGQTEAASEAVGTRGKERLENVWEVAFLDATAIV